MQKVNNDCQMVAFVRRAWEVPLKASAKIGTFYNISINGKFM